MNVTTVLMLVMVLGLGLLLLVILATTRRKSGKLNVAEFRAEWSSIMKLANHGDAEMWAMAVLKSDKLLDKALKGLGISGVTMAERIKTAQGRFSHPKQLWVAHGLRNKIAHESDFKLRAADARRALAIFRRALKELGAI